MRIEGEKIRDLTNVPMRIPSELKEKLKKFASQNKQSMNAEIIHRLMRTIEEDENSDLIPMQEQLNDLYERVELLEVMVNKLKEMSGSI